MNAVDHGPVIMDIDATAQFFYLGAELGFQLGGGLLEKHPHCENAAAGDHGEPTPRLGVDADNIQRGHIPHKQWRLQQSIVMLVVGPGAIGGGQNLLKNGLAIAGVLTGKQLQAGFRGGKIIATHSLCHSVKKWPPMITILPARSSKLGAGGDRHGVYWPPLKPGMVKLMALAGAW